jgi:hypothetical protein
MKYISIFLLIVITRPGYSQCDFAEMKLQNGLKYFFINRKINAINNDKNDICIGLFKINEQKEDKYYFIFSSEELIKSNSILLLKFKRKNLDSLILNQEKRILTIEELGFGIPENSVFFPIDDKYFRDLENVLSLEIDNSSKKIHKIILDSEYIKNLILCLNKL